MNLNMKLICSPSIARILKRYIGFMTLMNYSMTKNFNANLGSQTDQLMNLYVQLITSVLGIDEFMLTVSIKAIVLNSNI